MTMLAIVGVGVPLLLVKGDPATSTGSICHLIRQTKKRKTRSWFDGALFIYFFSFS
jgi:hypothetical protein